MLSLLFHFVPGVPAGHVLCEGAQISTRSEVAIVELQVQVVRLQVGETKDARASAGELADCDTLRVLAWTASESWPSLG